MNDIYFNVRENLILSMEDFIAKILEYGPKVLGALGVFIIGLLLSWLIGKGIYKIAHKVKLPHFAEQLKFKELLLKAKIHSEPSEVVAKFIQGWIMTIFLLYSTNILQLYEVSIFLEKIIRFLPSLAVAILIVLFAVQMGDIVGALVESALSLTDSHAAQVLSIVSKNILIAFGIMAALVELQIAAELIQILFTGFIAMLALGGGLAFGLGGKEVVQELLEDLRSKTKTKTKGKFINQNHVE